MEVIYREIRREDYLRVSRAGLLLPRTTLTVVEPFAPET